MNEIIINSNNFIPLTWFLSFLGLGVLMIWYQGTKSYDKGMTEAVLLHREGRLTYSDYVDERGVTMVDIQIEPKDY
jgi:hypothetical protein